MSRRGLRGVRMFTWYIPDGYVPSASDVQPGEVIGHEAVAVLNDSDEAVALEIDVYFVDKEPDMGHVVTIGARRSARIILGDDYPLDDALRISVPTNTPYSMRIRAQSRVHLQFTRVDSRQTRMALMSVTIPCEETE